MRVLIDTNLVIERENYHVLPKTLQELLKVINTLGITILVHPRSKDELKRDGNEERRKIALSKINTYPILEFPPEPDFDNGFLDIVGKPLSVNDYVDNTLLYAVYRNAVDFLISEDKGIHDKALRLGLTDRILSTEEALDVFRKDVITKKVGRPPAIKDKFVYNLNINDPFFDSLKKEYSGFEQWFEKISRQGRKCWVYFEEDGSIGALLIYKEEYETIDSIPPLSKKKRLKLCTFKVTHIGHKIGELFIKLSVEYCVRNEIPEMYLTHYTKKGDYLVSLLTDFGFSKIAKKINGEDVSLKSLLPDKDKVGMLSPSEISKIYYPSFYDGPTVRKFIVPIRPEYHNRLFIDYRGRQATMPEYTGEFVIEGNTISKAYLSHSKISTISRGDVLMFYRSRDYKELTSLGIVEDIAFRRKDAENIIKFVGKRTVYTINEIKTRAKKPNLVILFRSHFHFPNPIKLDELKEMNVLQRAPQSIMKIRHVKYLKIKEGGRIDERYTVS